jgi:hypothetical protein
LKLTRRQFAAGLALATADPRGLYRLIDRMAHKPVRSSSLSSPVLEQHLLRDLAVIREDGVEVIVPPLHHRVVTARVEVTGSRGALHDARTSLEQALAALERDYSTSPSGLGVTVAWGLPYFRRLVPSQSRRLLPVDERASAARGRVIRVLEDTERFPSDPMRMVLEQNDVAVLLRSDDLDAIDDGQRRLTSELAGLFAVTSVRSGFIGGGFTGKTSLPKRMAVAGRIVGAGRIPDTAQLFLGFTSTVKHALGPPKIANLETLGYAKLGDPYFVGGTHMHLSHLFENLNAWYLNFDHAERAAAMFRPGIKVEHNAQTVRQSASDAQSTAQSHADYVRHGRIGHAGAIQSASRLQHDVAGRDGTLYRKGTAVPQRADFNTIDNPFAWSARRNRDRMRKEPAAGTHFVVFNPTADDFRRVRLAMDGILPNGIHLDFPRRSNVDPSAASPALVGQGINSVFHATHRQNFLVPPRSHRSFPLSELRR